MDEHDRVTRSRLALACRLWRRIRGNNGSNNGANLEEQDHDNQEAEGAAHVGRIRAWRTEWSSRPGNLPRMLLLVRHGQTAANADGLLLGRADPPLSNLGREQAAALAAHVPPGARIIASPLRRARETADAFGAAFEIDERWIELDYGDLDGMPLRDVPADLWTQWRADVDFVPPRGESLAALGARVRIACDELLAEIRDRDVVVVSHVSPIKAALAWALSAGDETAWHLFVEVASIARIGADRFGTSVRSLNEKAP